MSGFPRFCTALFAVLWAFGAHGAPSGAEAPAAMPLHPVAEAPAAVPPDPVAAARAVDEKLEAALRDASSTPAETTGDEVFLRRAAFDLLGRPPESDLLAEFVLDPGPDKRLTIVRELLASDEFARSEARYWRDVIGHRAQDRRFLLVAGSFEAWLAGALAAGRGWDAVATDLITAVGPVEGDGRTALIVAQTGEAVETAAEVSRLFLGLQIQCAQCHDHPYDGWKREDFHRLAAFFPRVRLERRQGTDGRPAFAVASVEPPRSAGGGGEEPLQRVLAQFEALDGDRDGKLAAAEAPERLRRLFGRLLAQGDSDKDGMLSRTELKTIRPPGGGRARAEHFMPDLEHPEAPGTLIHPAFFAGARSVPQGLGDLERRRALAEMITSAENPWFARAVVNRVWGRLLGAAFVEPADDMGPGKPAAHPEALDILAGGFRTSGYRLQWLYEAVMATRAYQRAMRPRPEAAGARNDRFAGVCPTRRRADEVFGALAAVLGAPLGAGEAPARGGRPGAAGPREAFEALFGFDPSLSPDDVQGSIPQALFLMHSPLIQARIRCDGSGPLARLLKDEPSDDALLDELYLRALGRPPTEHERSAARRHVATASTRGAAFEDILWCLVNSTELVARF